MFIRPPKVPFLPSSKEEVFQIGDPTKLKNGVILKEKKEKKEKKIFSLYDMDLNVKYITDKGHTVQRISDKQITIKIKSGNVSPVRKESQPIAIPESFSAIPIRKTSKGRAEQFSFDLSDESIGRRNRSGSDASDGSFEKCGSIGSRDEENDLKIASSPFFQIIPSWNGRTTSLADRPEFSASPGHDNSSAFKIVVDILTPYIPGEQIERIVEDVILMRGTRNVNGTLYITNYQLIFVPTVGNSPTADADLMRDYVMVPLASILRFDKVDKQNPGIFFGGESSYSLDIITKDFRRTMRFVFDPSKHQRRDICDIITSSLSPKEWCTLFAVSSFSKMSADSNSNTNKDWFVYDAVSEYERMGINSKATRGWRFHEQPDYSLCDSYPKLLVIPDNISNEELQAVAGFRTKGRIPVLSWRNIKTGVTLTRCSQPNVGLSGNYRCKADEKLISLIQGVNLSNRKLRILDARPMANALANRATGGGYENLAYYPGCELEFMNIANIHVIRDSWNKLKEACDTYSSTVDGDPTKLGSNWLSVLEATRWLDNLATILSAAVKVADSMENKNESVLVHCSDGWDRTPQVCSLAQLLMDKYYRTTSGFCILLDKEWIQFGHKFAERLGFSIFSDAYKDTERCPIFLQFLDAVWQIMQQYPHAFEFSEELLITLMEHAYSGRFGNFLLNSNKEREEHKLHEISPSIWTYILTNVSAFKNPFYQPEKEPSVLFPVADVKNLHLWKTYYLRNFTENPQQYENKYTIIGKEMRSALHNYHHEMETLRKEKEVLEEKMHRMEMEMEKLRKQNPLVAHHFSRGNGKEEKDIFGDWTELEKDAK